MSIENTLFKQIMRQWASGVTVITTLSGGKWIGVTASAFSSVSAEPPLVLACLHRKLYTHQMIADTGAFAVNILSAEQVELGKRFAGMSPHVEDRFAGLRCATAITGCPLLPQTLAWMDCRVKHSYEGGDHTIFVGEVLAGGVPDEYEPLLYHRQRWGQFSEVSV